MFCRYCGNEIRDEAVVCIHCGCPTNSEVEDKVSVGLCILAVIIPLFGLVYWAIKLKEKPKNAKAIGLCALIAAIVWFFIRL